MKLLLLILFSLLYSLGFAQVKKVVVTVDDLPVVRYGPKYDTLSLQITQNLIKTFNEFDIPAIGYVNERKLLRNGKPDQNQLALLEYWLSNGYELGNHTYSHMNYHRSSFEDFTADVLKGEVITKELAEKYDMEVRFFRHPYLRSGLSKAHSDSLTRFLTNHGYVEAPVTIDNEDYIFAKAYSVAHDAQNTELMRKIGEAYIDYMEKKILYFERISNDLFARNISQTLLIHANLLNSEYFDELAAVYKKHGYTFVTQGEALEDEAYRSEITKFGDWGISILERIAISRGMKGDFFKGDPATPEFVRELGN